AKAAAGGTSWHTAGDDSPTSTESRDRSSQDGDWGHGCLSGASGDWTEDAIAVEASPNEAHTSAGNSTAAEGRSSGVSHQSMVGGPSVAVRVPRAGIFSLRHVQSADADLEKYVMKLGEEWRKDVVDEWRREKGVEEEADEEAGAAEGRPEGRQAGRTAAAGSERGHGPGAPRPSRVSEELEGNFLNFLKDKILKEEMYKDSPTCRHVSLGLFTLRRFRLHVDTLISDLGIPGSSVPSAKVDDGNLKSHGEDGQCGAGDAGASGGGGHRTASEHGREGYALHPSRPEAETQAAAARHVGVEPLELDSVVMTRLDFKAAPQAFRQDGIPTNEVSRRLRVRVRGELRGHNRGRILREGLGLGLRWLRTRVGRQSSFRVSASPARGSAVSPPPPAPLSAAT
ncbi:hypothetical protein T484DRAFT_1826572, partial [Baffinella frigidus]